MSQQLVECVPNFSEGRRMDVVEQILDAVRATPGVVLLDHSSDADHNRSVVTFVGSPESVEAAAFASIAKAAELINLDEQEGEHPRIGATDVVPFIPISGVTMQDCVAIANRLGKRVGEELNIPVYLYEEAATRPERENLATLRKGEYEGLKEAVKTDPDRQPDYGPAELGTAGATVIGARNFLVAYNVYLDTDDISVAKKIGKAVRHSSGGLRYVKGLGLLVDGQAQVSMNLTNFKRTPMHRVVEMIRSEAARYGTTTTHSELVGMIPQQALVDAAVWYLQMDLFSEDQILENKIAAEMQTADGSDTFLEDLASDSPTPGGGSAAAYSAAMAAGLAAMVARVTVGKKKYAEVEAEMQEVIAKAETLRAQFTEAVAQDAEAFNAVMAAFKLPKSTAEEKEIRSNAIQDATLHASKVPLSVVEKVGDLLPLIQVVAEKGNSNAITDAGSAAALAQAALTGAGMNVRINLGGLKDLKAADEVTTRLSRHEAQAASLLAEIHAVVQQRGQIETFSR